MVTTNYFKINDKPGLLYQYSLDFGCLDNNPKKPIKKRGLKRELIKLLFKEDDFRRADVSPFLATNWNDLIVSTLKLPKDAPFDKVGRGKDYRVTFHGQVGSASVTITVRFANEINTTLLDDWSQGGVEKDCEKILTAMNIITQSQVSKPDSGWENVGKNKFFPALVVEEQRARERDLGDGLHYRHGLFTSVRPGKGNILLNVNLTTSAFHTSMTLSNLAEKLFDTRNVDAQKFENFIKGLQVRLTYVPPGTPKNQDKLARMLPLQPDEFPQQGALRTVSGVDKTWNMEIIKNIWETRVWNSTNPGLPAVNIGGKDHPNWVPAEFLWIEPYQPYRRQLPPKVISKMVKVAQKNTADHRRFVIGEAKTAINFDKLRVRTIQKLHVY